MPGTDRVGPEQAVSVLFSRAGIGALELANRIVVAPMCQYSAEDGRATDWHLMHLGQLALSGAGLLITEATAVLPEGRISPVDLGLYDDACEEALARVLSALRRHAPIAIGVQLAHAGRKASVRPPWDGGKQIPPDAGGWQTVAPSAIGHAAEDAPPRALDAAGLERVRTAFVEAARRAVRLGVDLIELHGAHGYLLHEFLSPLANRRGDSYGGTLDKRMRFPLEVFDAVRRAVPDNIPVGIRISASDWLDDGWDLGQSIALARALDARGCNYIHVSSGGISNAQKIPLEPGYQIPFAEAIRKAVAMPVIGVGLITEPGHAEKIVASGQADFVALARGLLYDPRWPWHAAATLGAEVHAPRQYWRCEPAAHRGLFGKR
ncbi:MAG: NADH:flavin oxidoreductase/NADH oxidase [Rhodocyclaceae bacterium]|nr:NADH:flavin oxidoreductase/NADH oxidase [Rhodocyclaceae bacterium]